MSRKAMQIALDALEANLGNWAAKTKAVEVLRQALETEQEPVGWLDAEISQAYTVDELADASGTGFLPLYTAPPKREWVGLTADEIQDLSYLSQKIDEGNSPWFDRLEFARAIEAKLKEKNV